MCSKSGIVALSRLLAAITVFQVSSYATATTPHEGANWPCDLALSLRLRQRPAHAAEMRIAWTNQKRSRLASWRVGAQVASERVAAVEVFTAQRKTGYAVASIRMIPPAAERRSKNHDNSGVFGTWFFSATPCLAWSCSRKKLQYRATSRGELANWQTDREFCLHAFTECTLLLLAADQFHEPLQPFLVCRSPGRVRLHWFFLELHHLRDGVGDLVRFRVAMLSA